MMESLRAWANSRQYSATGASRSRRPREARMCAQRAVAPFGGREYQTHGFLRPRRTRIAARRPAPQVHHDLPAQDDTDRGADLPALLEIPLKFASYRLKLSVARPLDVHRAPCPYDVGEG